MAADTGRQSKGDEVEYKITFESNGRVRVEKRGDGLITVPATKTLDEAFEFIRSDSTVVENLRKELA